MPIVKYRNRKLYDLDGHRYVTLAEVADLVRSGSDVTITERASGRDVTSQILAECVWEEEKRRPHLDAGRLAEVIRTGVVPAEEVFDEDAS